MLIFRILGLDPQRFQNKKPTRINQMHTKAFENLIKKHPNDREVRALVDYLKTQVGVKKSRRYYLKEHASIDRSILSQHQVALEKLGININAYNENTHNEYPGKFNAYNENTYNEYPDIELGIKDDLGTRSGVIPGDKFQEAWNVFIKQLDTNEIEGLKIWYKDGMPAGVTFVIGAGLFGAAFGNAFFAFLPNIKLVGSLTATINILSDSLAAKIIGLLTILPPAFISAKSNQKVWYELLCGLPNIKTYSKQQILAELVNIATLGALRRTWDKTKNHDHRLMYLIESVGQILFTLLAAFSALSPMNISMSQFHEEALTRNAGLSAFGTNQYFAGSQWGRLLNMIAAKLGDPDAEQRYEFLTFLHASKDKIIAIAKNDPAKFLKFMQNFLIASEEKLSKDFLSEQIEKLADFYFVGQGKLPILEIHKKNWSKIGLVFAGLFGGIYSGIGFNGGFKAHDGIIKQVPWMNFAFGWAPPWLIGLSSVIMNAPINIPSAYAVGTEIGNLQECMRKNGVSAGFKVYFADYAQSDWVRFAVVIVSSVFFGLYQSSLALNFPIWDWMPWRITQTAVTSVAATSLAAVLAVGGIWDLAKNFLDKRHTYQQGVFERKNLPAELNRIDNEYAQKGFMKTVLDIFIAANKGTSYIDIFSTMFNDYLFHVLPLDTVMSLDTSQEQDQFIVEAIYGFRHYLSGKYGNDDSTNNKIALILGRLTDFERYTKDTKIHQSFDRLTSAAESAKKRFVKTISTMFNEYMLELIKLCEGAPFELIHELWLKAGLDAAMVVDEAKATPVPAPKGNSSALGAYGLFASSSGNSTNSWSTRSTGSNDDSTDDAPDVGVPAVRMIKSTRSNGGKPDKHNNTGNAGIAGVAGNANSINNGDGNYPPLLGGKTDKGMCAVM